MKSFFKKIIVPIITWQAMHILGRFQPKVIAVTGSVGKTSTKEAIYTFIKDKFDVRKSEKSFNSEIGVPLTILGLPNAWSNPVKWIWNLIRGFWIAFFSRHYPKILILEVGADKAGDIGAIVSWLEPDIAVVTALPDVPVHVENFSSPEEVYEEKSKLVKALPKEGIAILNADQARVLKMRELTGAKVLTFGMANLGEISYSGFHNHYPILAAAAVAKALGMSAEEIKQISANIETPPGRMRKLPGINGSTIIDDTYNSSPAASEYALQTLKDLKNNGRKIAVLGDMLELGEFSEAEHRKIGNLVLDSADMLLVVGPKARWIFDEAKQNRTNESRLRDFKICEDSVEAGIYLKNLIAPGDVVLVKGSQSMRMEKVVEQILANPENNKKFLVRQDKEWSKI